MPQKHVCGEEGFKASSFRDLRNDVGRESAERSAIHIHRNQRWEISGGKSAMQRGFRLNLMLIDTSVSERGNDHVSGAYDKRFVGKSVCLLRNT